MLQNLPSPLSCSALLLSPLTARWHSAPQEHGSLCAWVMRLTVPRIAVWQHGWHGTRHIVAVQHFVLNIAFFSSNIPSEPEYGSCRVTVNWELRKKRHSFARELCPRKGFLNANMYMWSCCTVGCTCLVNWGWRTQRSSIFAWCHEFNAQLHMPHTSKGGNWQAFQRELCCRGHMALLRWVFF